MPGVNFTTLTGRWVTAPLVRYILATAMQLPVDAASKARLAVAVEMASRLKGEAEATSQEVLAAPSTRLECANLVGRLIVGQADLPNERQVARQAERRAKDAETTAKNVEVLAPEIESMRSGHTLDRLAWAARLYLRNQSGERPVGVDLVTYYTNDEIGRAHV